MAVLVLIWGSTWSAIRLSLQGFAPFTGATLRFSLAGVVLLAVAGITGVRLAKSRRELWLWAVQAVLTFLIPYGTVYWAEQWVPTGLTAVLFSTFPIFIVLFASILLPEERLRPIGLLGIALGFGGVAVIFSGDLTRFGGHQVLIGALVILISPVSAGISNVVVKRWGVGVHPLALNAVPMTLAAALFATVAAGTERDLPVHLDTVPIIATLYLALFGSALSFNLYFWLLQRVSATRLSMITYAIPVVAVAIGTVFLDEPLTLRLVLGSMLVVAGVGCILKLT